MRGIKDNLHNVTSGLGVGINAIDSSLNHLLLQMTQFLNVSACLYKDISIAITYLLDLDLRVTTDNTETCARCVEEATIKLLEDGGHLATIVVYNNCVAHSKTM